MLRQIVLCAMAGLTTLALKAQVKPIPYAHAHNDYEHPHPLMDALANGFTSVEADVYLIHGELYVSHDTPAGRNKKRTLKALYLKPLKKVIKTNDGQVYPGYHEPFYLMIDIKSEPEATYAELKEQLFAFRNILTSYLNEDKKPGVVTVFLSGNRPIATVTAEQHRLVALDGRPADLGKNYTPSLMPVISDSYNNHFQWQGKGPMPKDEKKRLEALAQSTKAEGKLLRLWASPENENVWRTLLEAGVGLINTDELKRFMIFSQQW